MEKIKQIISGGRDEPDNTSSSTGRVGGQDSYASNKPGNTYAASIRNLRTHRAFRLHQDSNIQERQQDRMWEVNPIREIKQAPGSHQAHGTGSHQAHGTGSHQAHGTGQVPRDIRQELEHIPGAFPTGEASQAPLQGAQQTSDKYTAGRATQGSNSLQGTQQIPNAQSTAGHENPYKAQNLDPRVDSLPLRPRDETSHSTASHTAGASAVGGAGLGAAAGHASQYDDTYQPSAKASSGYPTDTSANYGQSSANYGQSSANYDQSSANYDQSSANYGLSSSNYSQTYSNHGQTPAHHGQQTSANYGQSERSQYQDSATRASAINPDQRGTAGAPLTAGGTDSSTAASHRGYGQSPAVTTSPSSGTRYTDDPSNPHADRQHFGRDVAAGAGIGGVAGAGASGSHDYKNSSGYSGDAGRQSSNVPTSTGTAASAQRSGDRANQDLAVKDMKDGYGNTLAGAGVGAAVAGTGAAAYEATKGDDDKPDQEGDKKPSLLKRIFKRTNKDGEDEEYEGEDDGTDNSPSGQSYGTQSGQSQSTQSGQSYGTKSGQPYDTQSGQSYNTQPGSGQPYGTRHRPLAILLDPPLTRRQDNHLLVTTRPPNRRVLSRALAIIIPVFNPLPSEQQDYLRLVVASWVMPPSMTKIGVQITRTPQTQPSSGYQSAQADQSLAGYQSSQQPYSGQSSTQSHVHSAPVYFSLFDWLPVLSTVIHWLLISSATVGFSLFRRLPVLSAAIRYTLLWLHIRSAAFLRVVHWLLIGSTAIYRSLICRLLVGSAVISRSLSSWPPVLSVRPDAPSSLRWLPVFSAACPPVIHRLFISSAAILNRFFIHRLPVLSDRSAAINGSLLYQRLPVKPAADRSFIHGLPVRSATINCLYILWPFSSAADNSFILWLYITPAALSCGL
ncbi:hypothetical protein DV735_g2101, partial [Chaetothyriales sp. CBS 134920]